MLIMVYGLYHWNVKNCYTYSLFHYCDIMVYLHIIASQNELRYYKKVFI